MSYRWAPTLLLLLCACWAMAWADRALGDDLEKFRIQNELKAQKLVREVQAALGQARDLERTDPARAREILRRVLAQLEDDLVLPERRRASMQQQVRDRLRSVIQAARAKEAADDDAAQKAADKARRQQNLSTEGPNPSSGPSAVAKDYFKSAKDRQEALNRLKYQRQKGFLGAMEEIDQSASVMTEQRITQRFVRATEMRQKKLTAREKSLLKALNSILSVDFDRNPFREVIDYLQEKTGQAIILDDASLKEAMVESDDPVTFKVKKVQVRTILRKILADRGLTYIIKEGSIQVVTPQKARDLMVVRSYPVADLVAPITTFGPFFDELMAMQNVQYLIGVIQNTVDPAIWQQGASITYFPPARSLVIRAPAEVHYSLGAGGF